MVADALTKLATANVIQVLVNAMDGHLPTRTMAHRTSVTPGKANRGDITGDGPMQNHCGSSKFEQNNNLLYIFIIYMTKIIYEYYICFAYTQWFNYKPTSMRYPVYPVPKSDRGPSRKP